MKAASGKVLIFGGTTEGRKAAEELLEMGIPCTVSVATHYGEEVLAPHPLMTVHVGRINRGRMAQMIQEGLFSCVIDATHPHAQIVSGEIEAACEETGCPYLRLQREIIAADFSADENAVDSNGKKTAAADSASGGETIVYVRDVEEAGAFLATVSGRILVTTGSKELIRFTKALGDSSRITARVLPSQESLRACAEAGLAGKQIFAMQGPFDLEMNCAQIHHADAGWLLTKETGAAGGYPEKIEAVRKCGIRAVVVRLPSNTEKGSPEGIETGSSIRKEIETGSSNRKEIETGATVLKENETETSIGKCIEAEAGIQREIETGSSNRKGIETGSSIRKEIETGAPENNFYNDFSKTAPPEAKHNDYMETGFRARPLAPEQAIEAALQYVYAAARSEKRRLFLIGVGVGSPEAATLEAQKAIASAEVLFGAKTVLENLTKTWKTKPSQKLVPIYDSGEILRYLSEHDRIRSAAVAYSGDSGFYSGASAMLAKIDDLKKADVPFAQSNEQAAAHFDTHFCAKKDIQTDSESDRKYLAPACRQFDVQVICGISSVSWFASRAGISWQNWKILSSHGRFCNVTGQVYRNRECFLLLSGAADLRKTGALLADAQERGLLGDLQLIYGYELSRPAEIIRSCTPLELAQISEEGLYVLYIRHENAEKNPVLPGLPDSAFIRGKAPMTSSEIRALSLCRLGLTSKAVLWDVGAGTGSVSVEAALTCPAGRVFSIEFKKDALALLEENRAKYCLQNMEIIEGRAPEALADLPVPTHVFIGGSGGEIGEILNIVLAKNPEAKIVVNCITSETLAALQTALKNLPVRSLQCTQVIVNREEMLGRYHYLRAGNPVFIISFDLAGTPF